jgi:hypothetical protein
MSVSTVHRRPWTSPCAYVAASTVAVLARTRVGLYYPIDPVHLPAPLRDRPGLRVIDRPSGWRWDRWYSSSPMAAAGRKRAEA